MIRSLILLTAALALTGCAEITTGLSHATREMYAAVQDGDILVPAVPDQYITEETARQEVDYYAPHAPGTIVVDPAAKRLYHLQGGNRAMRYVVGVGAAGFGFSGENYVAFQRAWPYWTPTANMVRRKPELYGPVKNGKPGGPAGKSPVGLRHGIVHGRR